MTASELLILFNEKTYTLTFLLNCATGEKMFTILCTFQMWRRPPGINNLQAILFLMKIVNQVETLSYS